MENTTFHILLADDDEADRLLFKEAFSELKINTSVCTVNNGVELMEYLRAGNPPLPHLVFLDLNMPGKDGLECLKEIKADEKLKEIFIAIYSTSDSEKDMEETFINGANVYIAKPADFNSLKKVLEKATMMAHLCQGESMKREHFLLRL